MTVFEFRSTDSFLHKRDVRLKLFCFALIAVTGLYAGYGGLCLLMMLPAGFLLRLGVPVKTMVRELRYFLLLLLFVFMARALSTPGDALISYKDISVTREGLAMGGMVCTRLFLTVILCMTLMLTTKISRIRDAVAWLFAPVPLIPEKRIATMIGLLVRFLPIVLRQANVISIAQRSRCIENRKHPIFRIRTFSIPFVRRVFNTADKLAIAMESRCYTEDRTSPGFSSDAGDRMMAAVCSVTCFMAVYIS